MKAFAFFFFSLYLFIYLFLIAYCFHFTPRQPLVTPIFLYNFIHLFVWLFFFKEPKTRAIEIKKKNSIEDSAVVSPKKKKKVDESRTESKRGRERERERERNEINNQSEKESIESEGTTDTLRRPVNGVDKYSTASASVNFLAWNREKAPSRDLWRSFDMQISDSGSRRIRDKKKGLKK